MAQHMTFTRRRLLRAGSSLTVLSFAAPKFLVADAAAAKEQRGGTLNSALWPEPPAILIGLSLTSPTLLPGSKMQEGLVTFDFKLNPQPVLAESWEVSADGLTYRFKLRRNVKWHDGKPFTADDVIYTFNEYIPAVHQRSRSTFALVTTTAEDLHTVVLKLKHAYPSLLRSLDVIGAPIMPAHIYAGKDIRKNPANRNPVGTGPFKFSEWRSGEYIRLVRNTDYWAEGRPYLDEIYYRFIPDSASRALALETGQLQLATQNDIELVDVGRLKALPNLKVSTQGWEWASTICWLELNLRRKPFDDVRFRKAVMHALNRDFIRDTIFFGMAKIATGPIHSSSPFYAPDLHRYEYDPAKARQLLDEMGLRPDSSGKRVEIGLLGLPYG
ncbi:MAG: ABC transporter substrate-binding protein, partial [Proteobacteria bacterium]|nr:ABC transporter substrate-binding protein [Pseudomonadota bacterium]